MPDVVISAMDGRQVIADLDPIADSITMIQEEVEGGGVRQDAEAVRIGNSPAVTMEEVIVDMEKTAGSYTEAGLGYLDSLRVT